MLTVAEKIQIARISTYLAFVDVQNGSLFGARLDPRLPQMLAMETDSVAWWYGYDSTDSTLEETTNYLYSLCGKYALKAQGIIGTSGGTISPVNPQEAPDKIEFEVDADSLIPIGGNSVILEQFKGWQVIFVRNNIPQYEINNGGTYYSFNQTTGEFKCFGDAVEDELFQIYATI